MVELARRSWLVFVLAAACLLVGGTGERHAEGDEKTVIRYATIAPAGSSFGKILKAWGRSLSTETEGRVEFRYYSGGSQGDERDFIRKMRAGQMDAAGVTAIGLGIVVRPVLVLSAPGVIETYEELARVREKMNDRFAKMFDEAGFILLAWSDAGKGHIMSTTPIRRPADLKSARPWAWKDDPVFAGYLTTIGANPVRVGVPEVYGGLQTRMLDTVPASALAAVALQWYTRLNYMAREKLGILVGGSLIKQEKFDELTEHDQKALIDTSIRAAKANDTLARRDDARAYASLVKRGMVEVDTLPYKAEWDAVAKKTRDNLAGRVYSKSLLEAVEKAVATQ